MGSNVSRWGQTCDSRGRINMPVSFLDRKCSCGHPYADHLTTHTHCKKCVDCLTWTYSETLDVGLEPLEAELLAALRRKFGRDTCANCQRTISLSDYSHDFVNRRDRYRITCQNCGEIFVEISQGYRRGDVRAFIEILEENPA